MPQTIVVPPASQWSEGQTLQSFIDRGIESAQQETEVVVLVPPGRYRTSISIQGVRAGTLVIRGAAGSASTWLDGTEPVPSTAVTRDAAGVYSFKFPDPPTLGSDVWASMGKPIGMTGRRRELVFVDDHPLRRVAENPAPGEYALSEDSALVRFVPFAADRSDYPPRRAAPPSVAVSARDTGISVTGCARVHVEGFTVSGVRSEIAEGAVAVKDSEDVSLSDVSTQGNSWDGVVMRRCTGMTVRSLASSGNGGSGAGAFRVSSLRIEQMTVSDNNRHAALGHFLDWATAGMKLVDVQNVTVGGFTCRSTPGNGLWFDYQCEEISVHRADISGCSLRGMFLEASAGPFVVTDSVFSKNRRGLFLSSVSDAAFARCVVDGNEETAISVFTDWGSGRENHRKPDGEPGFVTFERLRFEECGFRLPDESSRLVDAAWYDYVYAVERFVRTSSFDRCVVTAPGVPASSAAPWFGLPRQPAGVVFEASSARVSPDNSGSRQPPDRRVQRSVWTVSSDLSLPEVPKATAAFARAPGTQYECGEFGDPWTTHDAAIIQDRGHLTVQPDDRRALQLRGGDHYMVRIASDASPDNWVLIHHGRGGDIRVPEWAGVPIRLEVVVLSRGAGSYQLSLS